MLTIEAVVADARRRGRSVRRGQAVGGVLGLLPPEQGGLSAAGSPPNAKMIWMDSALSLPDRLQTSPEPLGGGSVARRLAAETVIGALRLDDPSRMAGASRLLFAEDGRSAPTLVVMSEGVRDPGETRLVGPDDVDMRALASGALSEFFMLATMTPRESAFERDEVARLREIAQAGGGFIEHLLAQAAPEIVVTRLPRMEPLCAPWPHLAVECGGQRSTAGVFAKDEDGKLGVTCCFHGTGPEGTVVTIGLRDYVVTRASEVQDTVFVAMPGVNLPDLAGLSGVRAAAPGQGDRARFDGATNGQRDTVVQSHDAGLLRRRPGVQLKVQTRPDTDRGDSGSALIDADDRVVGFAFEKTAFDDWPQFTDWIWAANALDALGLTPVAATPAQGG